MADALFGTMSLIGPSGHLIIATILLLLVVGVGVNLALRARYALLDTDLRQHGGREPFRHRVLNRIEEETRAALARRPRDINTQAIIEHNFQLELRGAFLGERFLKSATGLMIILGLVGTFYGLTISIARLVVLVSGDVAGVTDLTQSLTRGLTEALAGMSVAFSTSLFGIAAAIVMTLVGVVSSPAERRTALMVRIEHYLDNELAADSAGDSDEPPWLARGAAEESTRHVTLELARTVASFGHSVVQLEGVVARFESALSGFSATTRDFREFNLHLKDNVQRMSLTFADLSDNLKEQARALTSGEGR
jgi:hypothetical protein